MLRLGISQRKSHWSPEQGREGNVRSPFGKSFWQRNRRETKAGRKTRGRKYEAITE